MAQSFSQAEWDIINQFLDTGNNASTFGIPERNDSSVVLSSWNIRKLGALTDAQGNLKKSAGATDMFVRYCQQCDLIAIQEVQTNTDALFDLCDRLNTGAMSYDIVMSDVTGKAPGHAGMAERSGFIYNTQKVKRGRLATDLSFDRTAVLGKISAAHKQALEGQLPEDNGPSFLQKARQFFSNLNAERAMNKKLKSFVQFIRSPHMVEFVIEGPGGSYEIYCVNAHLVSTGTKLVREREFFALLEWLLLQSPETVVKRGKLFMIMADLNLDFKSSVDKRKKGIEDYITSLNQEKNMDAKVNFPFLDGANGGFKTNARENQTFDHIAYIAEDTRWPRGRHNGLKGSFGPDGFDYGMFNFTQAFMAAGPGKLPNGKPDFDRFSHDFSDHMPIWLRMPLPSNTQHRFIVP